MALWPLGTMSTAVIQILILIIVTLILVLVIVLVINHTQREAGMMKIKVYKVSDCDEWRRMRLRLEVDL